MTHRTLLRLFAGTLITLLSITSYAQNTQWTGTWAASPMPAGGLFGSALELENQTLRQIVHSSVGGEQIKVRISNAFGTTDLLIGSASIALQQDEGASIVPSSHHPLTFSGQTSITVPAGAFVISDAANLSTEAFSNISISLFLPEATGPVTSHSGGLQTSYISSAGDFTNEVNMPIAEEVQSVSLISGVQVSTGNNAKVLVAFGDSITDGTASTPDTNRRWPNFLARRMASESNIELGILNHGIAGNRVLHDTIGQNAVARFERDVLSWPNLSHIVIMVGINDIGFSAIPNAPFGDDVHSSPISAEQLIAAYRQLIARAHARNISIIGATLTPFNGASYFSEAGEQKRQQVNDWIRSSGEYDAVIDFDLAVRDPNDPSRMQESLQSGDWLHPSDAGYEVMAEAIDLSLFE